MPVLAVQFGTIIVGIVNVEFSRVDLRDVVAILTELRRQRVNVQFGRFRFTAEFTETSSKRFLLLDVDILVSEEDDITCCDCC
jgi:hypothetical protein